MTTINIKNMVCPRCITAVSALLVSMGFTVKDVILGEAKVEEDLSEEQVKSLADKLLGEGFELHPRIQFASPSHKSVQTTDWYVTQSVSRDEEQKPPMS